LRGAASIFVKLGIPTCLSCCVISFCLFLHLPKGDVNDVQHLRRILSRSEGTVAYVESGDVTGRKSAGQVHPCYLVWSFEFFFGLVPWPVGPLAFKDVGRAVRAAYSSPFLRCKNAQLLGRAVPWNSAILRALSARRTSGPGRNRISTRKEVKVSCISFF
jgi:hypothetical protein